MALASLHRDHPRWYALLKHGVLPSLFYFAAFCLLTFPRIYKFASVFWGDASDGLQFAWSLWWVNAVVHRPDLYPSLWQTTLVHWPYGTSLAGHSLTLFNGFLAVLLLNFLPMAAAYNAIVLFGFVMGGLSLYGLAYELTRSFWPSLLAGFLFTFSSYHFMHAAAGHLDLVSLEWLPLFLLLWYRLITRPAILTAISAAVVLGLVLLCNDYYFLYGILAAILIAIWYAFTRRDARFFWHKEYAVPLAAFVGGAALLAGPLIGFLLIANAKDPLVGFHDPVLYSLDLLAPVIPGVAWFFNGWTQSYWSRLPGKMYENGPYLSLPVLLLMGYVWVKRKTLDPAARSQVYLWSAVLVFFLLLALGPALHIAGTVVWDKAMPYTLLGAALPLLKLSGVPVRMSVMVILGASLLSAIAVQQLWPQLRQRKAIAAALLALLLFESLPAPLPATRVEIPDYVKALAALPADGGVIDLVTTGRSLPMYYQTIHGKPLAFGYLSRLPASVAAQDEELDRVIRNQDYVRLCQAYHFGYILTHDTIRSRDVQAPVSIELAYDQARVKIYRLQCSSGN